MNVIADGPGRILHYYINMISKLGVFRLRVSDEEAIPIGLLYLFPDGNVCSYRLSISRD
jgi:hypothetical protein